MSDTVRIESSGGRFVASWTSRVDPSVELEGTGETREDALDALAGLIDALFGELGEAMDEVESL